jgi:YVTN family beta-propeller protein
VLFRLLGPLEVSDGDHPARLGEGRQRAVLILLLLDRNQAVSSDRLIDALWGEAPPPTAAKVLQNYVGQLRRALDDREGGRLQTRGHGYAIRVEDRELDVDRFEQLVEEGGRALERGRAAEAAARLREALALWRGPALADVAYEAFAQGEIARLEERRTSALEQRIDADLALGRHADLVAELEALVAQHPLRERVRAQLMVALYRCGRQADALAAYGDARRALIDELGVEPGPALRELQAAILRQEPELGPARGAWPRPRRSSRRRRALLGAGGVLLAGAAVAAAVLAGGSGTPVATSVPANAVGVIDPDSGRVVASVPVGVRPGPPVQAGGSVWVANLDDNTITRIDAGTRRVQGTLTPGGSITGLAAGGGALWVGDATSGVAKRIDPTIGAVAQRTELLSRRDGPPQSADVQEPVAFGAGSVWAAHWGVITRLDASGTRRLATILVGDEPVAIAVGAGATWVTDDVDGNVLKIVDDAVVARIRTGDGPDGIAVGAGAVWVAQRFDGTVARIDPVTNEITNVIRVGQAPRGVTVLGGSVWVANSGDGTLSEIDAGERRVVRTLRVGNSPVGLAAIGGRLWVSAQAPAADVARAPRALPGGVARFDLRRAPDSLDPALAYSPGSWQLLYPACAKLYNYPDASGAPGTRVVPEVAQGQPRVSRDGLRHTFTIRRGFRFSPPSGAPVTAQTFRHAIERDIDPIWRGGAPAIAYLNDVVGARAFETGRARHVAGVTASGNRLAIRTTRPAPDLPLRLSLPFFCAVPDNAPARRGGIATLPMAGPYYVKSAITGRQVVLARNPNYRGPRPARLDVIDVRIGARPTVAVARVIEGTDDYYSATVQPDTLPLPLSNQLEARYGAARGAGRQRFFVNESGGVTYLMLNTARKLFAHLRLRLAANFAIDRAALAAQSSAGFPPHRPTDQYLAPTMPGYRNVSLYPLHGDIARARRLAGPGRHHANLLICDRAPCPQWAAIVRSNLAKIGIDVTVQEVPLPVMFAREGRRDADYDIAFLAWFPDLPDPHNVLNKLLRGNNLPAAQNVNVSLFDDPVYNRRLDAAARLTGPARYAAYAKLDADLAGKAAPMIAFGLPLTRDFFSARIGCQVFQPTYGMDLAALCVER